ncbi:hypothetical protein WISP_86698 [Willisornis vidua]|uniref:SAM domain-containing protein n=1 Tax=Willisornis vidua TaxID=1566151 RepID=A0ABQ9D341_9PASS|nr:hypothetical protein WISP_86698 [Willisornis vidua]
MYSLISEQLCQSETSTESELPEGHPAEQFAGLLHGSSPAYDPPENPLHLYSKANPCSGPLEKSILSKSTVQQIQLRKESNSDPPVKKKKPPVVNRTIFHTKNKPVENHTLVGTPRISEQWVTTTGGFVERACTLGRIRSLPKTLLEMHLCKNVSKSDSNLITHPPNDKKARSNWSEPTPKQQCSKGNSERTPSFTSEWEEIDKIMSSIDAGINTGLGEMNDHTTNNFVLNLPSEDLAQPFKFAYSTEVHSISTQHSLPFSMLLTGLNPEQLFIYKGPRCPVQTVGQWLENIGLPQYENHLLANGFDNVQFMKEFFSEGVFPHTHSEPTLVQLEPISSCPIPRNLGEEIDSHLDTSFQVVIQSDKVSLEPPLLQTKCPQLPQLLLIRLVLHILHQLHCPSLESLQHFNVFLVVKDLRLSTGFKMWSHQHEVQGDDSKYPFFHDIYKFAPVIITQF